MRKNSFNFIRLFFASLVILSHSTELIDGDRSREPLRLLANGPMSFGQLAVVGFFVISGYLITGSWISDPNPKTYFTKRVLRIYPAFIANFAICIFIVTPLAGIALASISKATWLTLIPQMLLLWRPTVEGVFHGLPYPSLNGAAWTIGYEFRCYILVALAGLIGLYSRRGLYLALTVVLLIATISRGAGADVVGAVVYHLPRPLKYLVDPDMALSWLLAAFLCGGTFRLYRDEIKLSGWAALGSLIALFTLLHFESTAFAAASVFGGYIVMYVARGMKSPLLWRIGEKNDISYGVYLYGWPIGMLLIWYIPGIQPVALGVATLLLAVIAGWISWLFIEKPSMSIKTRLSSAVPA